MLLDVIKDGELVDTHELSASKRVYKVGRQAGVADIVLTHGSISREHATITVSASGSVVVVDLGSAQGTTISGKPLVPNKPHLLPPGRSLTFGQSTRTFKLREGGSGFVSGEAGAAAVARAPQSAASLDDLRVQPVLQVLRAGASDCERPRPDGFVRLMSVVASAAVQRAGCTELELASLPARFVKSLRDDHGGGRAPSARPRWARAGAARAASRAASPAARARPFAAFDPLLWLQRSASRMRCAPMAWVQGARRPARSF